MEKAYQALCAISTHLRSRFTFFFFLVRSLRKISYNQFRMFELFSACRFHINKYVCTMYFRWLGCVDIGSFTPTSALLFRTRFIHICAWFVWAHTKLTAARAHISVNMARVSSGSTPTVGVLFDSCEVNLKSHSTIRISIFIPFC